MKETHYKLKHRVTALFAAAVMLCSMLPGAAFAEEPTPQPTEETVQMEQQTEPSETDNGQTDESSPDPGEDVTEATPETAEEQPAEEEIPAAVVGAELYTDLPNAPIGSYIGSEGLPVATGETKIGISEWPESQLEEGGSYLTAAALDNDGLTMAAPLLDGADYAIVPIMAQVEYPADGSSTDMFLPDGVTLLDFYGEPVADADALLHNSYHETSAAVMSVYVQAAANFAVQLVYTGPDGSTQTKTLYVTIDREHTVASPFADAGIAAYGERPIPDVTSGKITKVAKVNGTWLIWFNGDEAYCCTPGADGQPKNCPLYTYVDTSMVGADQYVPGDHYGNQYRIWGGLTQLSLGMQELPPVALSAEAPSLLDSCRTIYTDAQMQIIENYPDSTAAKILMESAQALLEGTDAYASARGYYTYIYQPGRAGWQTVAVIGPEISDDEPNPKPIVQEIYANWEAPAQTASGSFDFDYGIITNKVQLKTTEKVDGATIEIEPITKSGTIDGGTWNISPADKQTVTTSGHTNDDNFQNNGGAASASWTLHYSVSKTTDSRNGRVGPYTTQDEADAAADSARDAAIAELQGEAQRMVDNAVASAKAELANVKFRYEEVGVPYGFEMYWGSNGSNQTISVPANSNNAYLMKNDEWSLQVNIKKTDSETGNQIAADAQYEIFQWDTVTGKYQPTGGYNTYSVQRQGDGTYAVINSAAYATTDSMRHTLYYTQRNTGKFIIVESKAPTGYFGDWTDINHPGIANTPLGKRGYYIEITEDSDNSVIWLDNADYNADIATTDKGGTKLVTRTGVETTVTIYDTAKDPSRTYNTDNSGKAVNEDSYTITPTDGVMKNDRTLGEISISKVDLDAVRYVGGSAANGTALASGQTHGDAALDGAVLVLSAVEGVQAQTILLWEALRTLQAVAQKQVDGLILVGSIFNTICQGAEMENLLRKMPVVLANGTLALPDAYSVMVDDCRGVEMAVEHLVKTGRRNLYYIKDKSTDSAAAKAKGFLSGMTAAGLDANGHVLETGETLEDGIRVVQQLLAEGIRPDGILCGEDLTAAGVLKALLRAGIRVPEETAVVGYDNSTYARLCEPELTSVDNKPEQVALLCVQLLQSRIEHGEDYSSVTLQPELVQRQSS